MSLISKIGIIYRFGRIRKGLLLVLFVAYLFYIGMHKNTQLDFTIVMIIYGIISTTALLFLFSGVRRLLNMIAVIERGTLTTATVSGLKEWRTKRSVWAGRGSIGSMTFTTVHKKGCIRCTFPLSSGKPHSLEVFFHNDEDQIKKGDGVPVIYDPGMPENALAVDALPRFVATVPAL